MASEASRKKAEEFDALCQKYRHAPLIPQDQVVAAFDALCRFEAARAEGERIGAERGRWECYQIASDFADRFGGTARAVAIRIASRGPMRGPEGCSDGCGAASDEHCWNSSDWADGATPMRGPEEE